MQPSRSSARRYLTGRSAAASLPSQTANVLFDRRFRVKLCDYGLAVGDTSEARLRFVGGTEQFMAPELLLADYGR